MNRAFGAVISDGGAGRIIVFASDGGVWPSGASLPVGGNTSLDGMEFRCAPSGANGCP